MLRLLFIDIRVGSIATGLEVAAVWGKWKVVGGAFCLQCQLSAGEEHSAQQGEVGEAEAVGEVIKGQGQSAYTGTTALRPKPLLLLAVSLSQARAGSSLGIHFLQELNKGVVTFFQ